MDIKQLTLESIQRYYKVLKKTGNVDYAQVYKLLLLTFIEELFSDLSWYITEKDYARLSSMIECISKSTCLVPWNKIAIQLDPIKNFLEDTPIRISENEIIRLAEADILRLLN